MIKLLLIVALLYLAYRVAVHVMTPAKRMPRADAARLLGVPADADRDTIVEAHRRLIGRNHPDAGGSADLAARINQARDTLLGATRPEPKDKS